MYTKRGQATVFIIIGLILLLSTGIFFYYATYTAEKFQEIPDEIDQASFKTYIESCIDATSNQVLATIETQGGYEPTYYRSYQGNNVAYWCYGEDDNQCVNTLITKDDLAQQLIYGIRDRIDDCLNFVAFELQGYSVQEGTLKGVAIIAPENIDITINYPIVLTKGNQKITVDNFHTTVTSSLGHLITIAQYIINEEATTNGFDTLTWQGLHANILFHKAKPYPTTIYTIEKDISSLTFAIEGIDTAANPGEILSTETNYGCCYIDNVCFANTPLPTCETKAGTYETAPCGCEEPAVLQESTQTECVDGYCNDCGSYKHGESWCDYGSVPGEGQDAPGSRHYVLSCFDGDTYVESCRDYREELCTQTDTGSKTKAVCRINRWQDCNACTTEECCANTEARDCYWNPALDTLTTQCTPAVPPGLKFWDYNGIEICARANEEQTCKGLHCSQEWVDATAMSCFSQADCGNDYNTVDVFTQAGFINSDLKFKPDEDVYKTSRMHPVTLPLHVEMQKQLLESPIQEATDIFLMMVTRAYQFVSQWEDITIPNYLNPFTPSPSIEIMDVSICMPWQAPYGANDCSACQQDDKPCTEYRCKSLGKKCVYEEKFGYPSCTPLPEEQENSFTIELDTDVIPENYEVEETVLEIEDIVYNGYKISPALPSYKPFTLGMKTTTEAVCRIDYTPHTDYFDSPMFAMGSSTFDTEHTITVRVPPQITIPSKLKDTLNLTTAEQIVQAMVEPKELLKNYEDKFPAVFSVYNTVTGDDLADELEPHVNELLDLIDDVEVSYPYYENLSITLLNKFDNGGYYLFVSCEDRFGNVQNEELFVEIDIADPTEDLLPPTILKMDPENNAEVSIDASTTNVYMYTDEPATCHYSYEEVPYHEMEYSFNCNNDLYDIVPVASGSYECRTTLETGEETTIFIACSDNPENEKSYLFSLQGSESEGVDGRLYSPNIPEETENPMEEYAEYISVSGQTDEANETVIDVTSYLLSDSGSTVFNVTTENTTMQFYTDDEVECTLFGTNITANMNCSGTSLENQNKGIYACSADMTVSPLFSIINTTETNTSEANETEESIVTTIEYTKEDYQIICSDGTNTNIQNPTISYTLQKSEGLHILSVSPTDNEEVETNTAVTVTTSVGEAVSCGYAEYGSIEYIQMHELTTSVFTTSLNDLAVGYNTYTIYCYDGIGNSAEQTVSFYVIS